MPKLIELRRPIRRRLGDLVIEIRPDGLTLRGRRRRNPRTYSWEQIASLAEAGDLEVIRETETAAGRRELARILPKRKAKR